MLLGIGVDMATEVVAVSGLRLLQAGVPPNENVDQSFDRADALLTGLAIRPVQRAAWPCGRL